MVQTSSITMANMLMIGLHTPSESSIATIIMSLPCTVSNIPSDISQNLKLSRDPERIHFGVI